MPVRKPLFDTSWFLFLLAYILLILLCPTLIAFLNIYFIFFHRVVEGPVVADLGGLPGKAWLPLDKFRSFVDTLQPGLRMMTIAPSVEASEGYARLRYLLSQNVLPALGHDRSATEEQILGALAVAGQRRLHITHLFNVCSFHHRLPSLVNVGLAESFPSLPKYKDMLPPTVELIADLHHVHPMALKLALTARSLDHVACVTDNIVAFEPGAVHEYGGRRIRVAQDRKVVYLDGTDTIAGSCASLLDAFQQLVNVLGVSIPEASQIVSRNPARFVGLEQGRLAQGALADMVLLTGAPEFELQGTVVRGRLVYHAAL